MENSKHTRFTNVELVRVYDGRLINIKGRASLENGYCQMVSDYEGNICSVGFDEWGYAYGVSGNKDGFILDLDGKATMYKLGERYLSVVSLSVIK